MLQIACRNRHLTAHRLIISCLSTSNSLNGNKPEVDVSDLIKSIDKESTEPKQTLQDLLENLKDKNHKNREELKELIKKRDLLQHKAGKEFWFQKPATVQTIKEIGNNLDDLDNVTEDDTLKPDLIEEVHSSVSTTPVKFKLEELKDVLAAEKDDNRNVTKLMSALIDDIDNDFPETEERLKSLMTAMSAKRKVNAVMDAPSQVTQLPDKRDKYTNKQKFSLTHGKTTNLFLEDSGSLKKAESCIDDFISLHEKQWIKDLRSLLPQQMPQNSFDVMALDINKQWLFPIDNEQDMGIEEETSFEEHVFLDHLLDEFPETGPIRYFMELVVTGLQHNPHLSVEEKKNRILWFRDYFEKIPDNEKEVFQQ